MPGDTTLRQIHHDIKKGALPATKVAGWRQKLFIRYDDVVTFSSRIPKLSRNCDTIRRINVANRPPSTFHRIFPSAMLQKPSFEYVGVGVIAKKVTVVHVAAAAVASTGVGRELSL
jgi:hypothetical protein